MSIELPAGVSPQTGLTQEEQQVIDSSVVLWNAFMSIDGIGGTPEVHEVTQALHIIQNIIAERALARLFPKVWR